MEVFPVKWYRAVTVVISMEPRPAEDTEANPKAPSRVRRFCFTDFLTGELRLLEYCAKLKYEYIIVGLETCPETGELHHQGYVEMAVQTRIDQLRRLLPGWHVEICKGSSVKNVEYCRKEGNVVLEDGECSKQGKRTDLDAVKTVALTNGMRAVCRTEGVNLQSIRFAEKVLTYLEVPRSGPTAVTWLWGPTGVGKSRYARVITEKLDTWVKNANTKWFDTYDAHEAIILDDWRDNWWHITCMLGLLDEYGYLVEFKGGHRQIKAHTIVVTCPFPPSECYSHAREENKDQLLRRIQTIIHMPSRGQLVYQKGTSGEYESPRCVEELSDEDEDWEGLTGETVSFTPVNSGKQSESETRLPPRLRWASARNQGVVEEWERAG